MKIISLYRKIKTSKLKNEIKLIKFIVFVRLFNYNSLYFKLYIQGLFLIGIKKLLTVNIVLHFQFGSFLICVL